MSQPDRLELLGCCAVIDKIAFVILLDVPDRVWHRYVTGRRPLAFDSFETGATLIYSFLEVLFALYSCLPEFF
jgi:hypothetical protein